MATDLLAPLFASVFAAGAVETLAELLANELAKALALNNVGNRGVRIPFLVLSFIVPPSLKRSGHPPSTVISKKDLLAIFTCNNF